MRLKNDGGTALRKYFFLFLFIFGLTLFPFAQEEDVLKIEISVSPKNLSRSQEGKLIMKLILQEGMVINPQPSFTIQFSPMEGIIFNKNKFTDSDLNIEILEEMGEEYLNLKDPFEIPFTISPDAAKGNHHFEGRIDYFVCSKEEGWCLKSHLKFTVSLSIN
ncbi:MAG: hypothetical protein PVF66_03195 [Candidatus Aminicenantes bacterium]|jgi:hypothetical protein